MTVAIYERIDSRKLDVQVENPSAEFEYLIIKTFDESEVRTIIESTISSVYTDALGGVLPFQNYTIEHQGNGIWYATARYSVRQQRGRTTSPVTGVSNVVNFEIGTQSVKLTQALETMRTYSTNGTAPDMKEAIGVNGDNVDGVDVDKPTMTFSETWHVDPATITTPFLVALRDLADKPINDAPFRGFDTGEVRFLGASGSQRDEQNFEITFRFAVSPNRDDLAVGTMDPIIKDGWEYLWVRYKDALDQNQLIKQPSDAYVVRVYDSSSFDVLGIGA